MYPRDMNEVFNSPVPSIATCRKEIGETKTRAAIVMLLTDTVLQFNTVANMNQDQVIETTKDIIEIYYWLKIDDLRLCFKNAMRGRYGDIYRIDGSVVLGWLEKYSIERIRAADESSYNQHQSTKSEQRINTEKVGKIYSKFQKK